LNQETAVKSRDHVTGGKSECFSYKDVRTRTGCGSERGICQTVRGAMNVEIHRRVKKGRFSLSNRTALLFR